MTEIEKLLRGAVVGKAADLAREGRYRDAAGVLDGLAGGEAASARVADLRARILAQEGRLNEAKQLWQAAAALDPAEPAYRDALRRIESIERRGVRPAGVWIARVATAVVVVAATLAGLAALERRLDRFRAALNSDVERILTARLGQRSVPAGAIPPDLRISVPGITVSQQQDAVALRFDSGLFESGARLTASAQQMLALLSRQLAPHASSIEVTVIGHADPEPMPASARFPNNAALSLARAAAVAGVLRDSAHLPSDALLVQGLGEQEPPYLNDSKESRRRNRSVVVKLRLRRDPAPARGIVGGRGS